MSATTDVMVDETGVPKLRTGLLFETGPDGPQLSANHPDSRIRSELLTLESNLNPILRILAQKFLSAAHTSDWSFDDIQMAIEDAIDASCNSVEKSVMGARKHGDGASEVADAQPKTNASSSLSAEDEGVVHHFIQSVTTLVTAVCEPLLDKERVQLRRDVALAKTSVMDLTKKLANVNTRLAEAKQQLAEQQDIQSSANAIFLANNENGGAVGDYGGGGDLSSINEAGDTTAGGPRHMMPQDPPAFTGGTGAPPYPPGSGIAEDGSRDATRQSGSQSRSAHRGPLGQGGGTGGSTGGKPNAAAAVIGNIHALNAIAQRRLKSLKHAKRHVAMLHRMIMAHEGSGLELCDSDANAALSIDLLRKPKSQTAMAKLGTVTAGAVVTISEEPVISGAGGQSSSFSAQLLSKLSISKSQLKDVGLGVLRCVDTLRTGIPDDFQLARLWMGLSDHSKVVKAVTSRLTEAEEACRRLEEQLQEANHQATVLGERLEAINAGDASAMSPKNRASVAGLVASVRGRRTVASAADKVNAEGGQSESELPDRSTSKSAPNLLDSSTRESSVLKSSMSRKGKSLRQIAERASPLNLQTADAASQTDDESGAVLEKKPATPVLANSSTKKAFVEQRQAASQRTPTPVASPSSGVKGAATPSGTAVSGSSLASNMMNPPVEVDRPLLRELQEAPSVSSPPSEVSRQLPELTNRPPSGPTSRQSDDASRGAAGDQLAPSASVSMLHIAAAGVFDDLARQQREMFAAGRDYSSVEPMPHGASKRGGAASVDNVTHPRPAKCPKCGYKGLDGLLAAPNGSSPFGEANGALLSVVELSIAAGAAAERLHSAASEGRPLAAPASAEKPRHSHGSEGGHQIEVTVSDRRLRDDGRAASEKRKGMESAAGAESVVDNDDLAARRRHAQSDAMVRAAAHPHLYFHSADGYPPDRLPAASRVGGSQRWTDRHQRLMPTTPLASPPTFASSEGESLRLDPPPLLSSVHQEHDQLAPPGLLADWAQQFASARALSPTSFDPRVNTMLQRGEYFKSQWQKKRDAWIAKEQDMIIRLFRSRLIAVLQPPIMRDSALPMMDDASSFAQEGGVRSKSRRSLADVILSPMDSHRHATRRLGDDAHGGRQMAGECIDDVGASFVEGSGGGGHFPASTTTLHRRPFGGVIPIDITSGDYVVGSAKLPPPRPTDSVKQAAVVHLPLALSSTQQPPLRYGLASPSGHSPVVTSDAAVNGWSSSASVLVVGGQPQPQDVALLRHDIERLHHHSRMQQQRGVGAAGSRGVRHNMARRPSDDFDAQRTFETQGSGGASLAVLSVGAAVLSPAKSPVPTTAAPSQRACGAAASTSALRQQVEMKTLLSRVTGGT